MTSSTPPHRSPWRFAAVAAALTTATVAAIAAGYLPFPPSDRSSGGRPAQTLLLTAAPQDAEVFLTWSPLPDARHVLGWRLKGETDWQTRDAGPAGHGAVTGLRNGASYEFTVEAHRDRTALAASPIARATPRPRPGCATTEYIAPSPPSSFFCTKAALDGYLAERGIDPLTLRCRQRPVSEWTADAPDCHYLTPDGEHLLLLRAADRDFSIGSGHPPPEVVREHARRAIWGPQDPFARSTDESASLAPRDSPMIGRVSRHTSAESFDVLQAHEPASVVTWFSPSRPHPGRFAIYHEGHGGAGVDIGAETIDWLLDRGWTVASVDMPLFGLNSGATRPGLQSHGDFEALDDGIVSPLERFLLPVKAVVDEIVARHPADPDILLIGRSGGGWTTYVYAALDPRIDIAVAVAGGRPLSTRLDAPWGAAEIGDYEQSAPHLYNSVPHEYLMLAAGSRAGFFVFNRWDNCCYRVQPDDAFVRYLRQAGRAARKPLGVFVDRRNSTHSMGPQAYAALDRFLARVLRP